MKENPFLNKYILWKQHPSNDGYFYYYENE